MYARSFDYYVLELDTVEGPTRLELYFKARELVVRTEMLTFSVKLTRENAVALTYLISRYVERVLSEEEIRALLV